MSTLDYGIVIVYLLSMIGVGLYFQRKASADIESYFLGQRGIPWWALGASGMSSNLDVSGTMINVALVFALGISGFFVEIRGGVTLIMAFLMIFMGKWNRRAHVMTLAEWMNLRFGKRRDGHIARVIAAFSNIVMTIAMITYFAIGSGKFIAEFLGIPGMFGLSPQFWAATLMIFLAMIYTVASGLYGVVWTDVFQSVIIFGTIVVICFIAFTQYVLPEEFLISLPMKGGGYEEFWMTKAAWTDITPEWTLNIDPDSHYAIYNLFGVAILFYLLKVTIEGSGGTSGYMIQRYFAAKSDKEAGLLSFFWTFLLSFRWPFIISIAMMGIGYGMTHGVIDDPETVLPVVINQLVPIGVKGFLVAGLMAAAMSTFDSTVNAGAAYWVKDIYQAYINPKASEATMMRHSRWSSVIIVLLGLAFSVFIRNINDIWGWLTMGIGAGLIVPMLVRWYWWRFNGYGFTAGTIMGMLAAFYQRIFWPDIPEYFAFSFAAGMSLVGIIVVTLLTPKTEEKVLLRFYKKTRPFGLWGHIKKQLPDAVAEKINKENRRDIFSIFFAVPWQLSLFLTWMMLMAREWDKFFAVLTILIVTSVVLYFSWYRHLNDEVDTGPDDPE